MPTSRRRCQPWRKISTGMWNSRPWEPRPALNIFPNPCWLFQSNPESNFFSTSSFNKMWEKKECLLFLYGCITFCTFLDFLSLLQTLAIDRTHSVHFPPAIIHFLGSVRTQFRCVKAGGEVDSKAELFSVRLYDSQRPQTSESSRLSSHDYKLGKAVYNSRAKRCRVREKGSRENLSVLFLDRGLGPRCRRALEWGQGSDLKHSSGFCGPGSALFTGEVTWAGADKDQKRSSQGFCDGALQLATVSGRRAPRPLPVTSQGLLLLLRKGMSLADSRPSNNSEGRDLNAWCCKAPAWRHRYWWSPRSAGCQTAMFTNILPPLTA